MEERDNYLEQALEIKEWIDKTQEKLPPSIKSKDEKEKDLAKQLKHIRKKLVKPYQKLKKEIAIKKFEEKYPNIYEIVGIIQQIDKNLIVQNIEKNEEEPVVENEKIDSEIEKNIDSKMPEFEYDEENDKQANLVNLIEKDIKLKKTLDEAIKLKQKYESD